MTQAEREERIAALLARKQLADEQPGVREQYRAAYDAICKELLGLLIERGQLPLELLRVRDDLLITVAAIGHLSHAILSGAAGPEQYADWVSLWRSLVEFTPEPVSEQEVFPI